MPTYWKAPHGARLHRRHGCDGIRKAGDTAEAVWRAKTATRNLCRYCFPDDPVMALLAEEGERYRAEQMCNEFAKSLYRELQG